MEMGRFTYKTFLRQLIFWTIYLIIWFYIFKVDAENHPDLVIVLMASFGIGQIIQANLTNYWLIPGFFYKGRYVLFALLIILMSSLAAQVCYISINALPGDINDYTATYNDWIDIFAVVIVISFFINAMVITLRVSIDRFKDEKEAEQLQKEKLATELKFLKAQINPHFLFNSFNTVFHLIDQNAEKSKVLLAKFSDILRYHLYQSEDEKVPLSLEIEHMKNYIEMEELRRGEMLEVSYTISDEIGYIEVPPLILLSFVENAFKHVSTDFHTKNWIHIHIYPQSEWLEICIENTVKKNTDLASHQQLGGLGLVNIRKRLEIIYGERHSLKITDDQETFKVSLKIKMI